ncbi:hypothetical protein CKO15_11345 [Halorhodospira abdelmalekii]|nr:hypothetical protein [Halorhodospira abdelmalekii]
MQLDHGGGAELRHHSATAIRLREPRLRALDIDGCPQLQTLDLREVAAGVVIAVSGCPQLHRILLPDAEPGAVIHWLGAEGESVEVRLEGSVAELDACLGTAELRLPQRRGEGESTWSGALLSNSRALPEKPDVDALCCIGATRGAAAHDPATLEVPLGPAALILSAGGWVRIADRDGSRLEQVCIKGVPLLCELHLSPPLQRLEVREAPLLEHIEATGETICLESCGSIGQPIELTGNRDWAHVTLADTGIDTAAATRAKRLNGYGSAAVHALAAYYQSHPVNGPHGCGLGPESVAALFHRAEAADSEAIPLFLRWAGSARRRHGAYALQWLCQLADTPRSPVPLARLWETRCKLRRHLLRQQKEPPALWQWDLPADQRIEAERADNRLALLAYQNGVDVVDALVTEVTTCRIVSDLLEHRQFHPSLNRTSGSQSHPRSQRVQHGQHASELAEVASELDDALLLRSLERPAWLKNREYMGRHKGTIETLHDIVQEIVRRPPSLTWANIFASCVADHLSDREALSLLEPLAEHGHAPSKAQAMAIALRPETDEASRFSRPAEEAELRRQAMAVALAPSQSQVFAAHPTATTAG